MRSLQKTVFLMNNEDGSVIIAALLVLVLLTIVGIASTNTSNNEIQIASHTTAYQQNFYRAEGAAIEAATLLEAIPDPLLDKPAWLELDAGLISDQNIRDWDEDALVQSLKANSTLAIDNDTQYIGIYTGVRDGFTLRDDKTSNHGYIIYGHCEPKARGRAVVQIGYIKAF